MKTKFMQVQEEFNIPWITELLHQVKSGGGLGGPWATLIPSSKAPLFSSIWRLCVFFFTLRFWP